MANSKLIIIEGPQGAGKTTITDFIRHKIPYTNLYRLNGTGDASPLGKQKSKEMYIALVDYMERLQNKEIHLLFDRTFFSEEVYCRLGFKDYSFTDVYQELLQRLDTMDFDLYYITLYVGQEAEFEKRLQRAGKATLTYAKFNVESSIRQQEMYLKIAEEVKKTCPHFHVATIDTCVGIEKVEEEVLRLLEENA